MGGERDADAEGKLSQLITKAEQRIGHKSASTPEFIGHAVQWLMNRTPLVMEKNDLDQRYKVTHGERFNSGNTLAIALANSVIDDG